MADQQHSGVMCFAKSVQLLQDQGPDTGIQCRGGFIRYDYGGFTYRCHGDHGQLAHTAG